jgi:hypothetical protein
MTFKERVKEWRNNVKVWWNNWRGRTEWLDGLQKITKAPNLPGIEKPAGVLLFILKTFVLTEFIQLFWNWKTNQKWKKWLPDCYVGLVTVFLFILLVWFPIRWIAIYFLASIIVYLLNVVLLDHKVFGGVRSPERSLILFMLNVVQVVLIFAILYRLERPEELGGWRDALVDALLVLGTVAVPFALKERPIAAFQVAVDFVLLAVFLAHFVGRPGQDDKKDLAPHSD